MNKLILVYLVYSFYILIVQIGLIVTVCTIHIMVARTECYIRTGKVCYNQQLSEPY